MKQIHTITLRALENDKHFSLMNSGINLFTAIQTENETFQDYLKAWQEAFQEEDKVMYLLRKSLELENAQIQHDLRCNCLTALLGIVRHHARCTLSKSYTQAKRLYAHLKQVRLNKKVGLDKMSSSIHHILEILNLDEFKPLIPTLGLQDIYESLKTSHEAVILWQKRRDEVDVTKQLGKGALFHARQRTDEAYKQFIACVEAMFIMFPKNTAALTEAVNQWNTTLTRYRHAQKIKRALAVKRKEEQGDKKDIVNQAITNQAKHSEHPTSTVAERHSEIPSPEQQTLHATTHQKLCSEANNQMTHQHPQSPFLPFKEIKRIGWQHGQVGIPERNLEEAT